MVHLRHKMNTLYIIGIVLAVIIVAVILYYYFSGESTTVTYVVTLQASGISKVLYTGKCRPYVSSNDSTTIAVAHGSLVDIFNMAGVKQTTISIPDKTITGIAYNSTAGQYIAKDSTGSLYTLDQSTSTATLNSSGVTKLFDTVGGFSITQNGTTTVSGTNATPRNGTYTGFSVLITQA